MNKFLTLLSTVIFASVICITESSFAKGKPLEKQYDATQVVKNVYVIHGPLELPNVANQGFMNNPAFILTEKGVVVVDPGGSLQIGEMLLAAIKKVSAMPIIAVFNTHVHGDHWLANQAILEQYPNVPIYGHPNMIEQVDNGAGKQWVDLMLRSTDGATEGTQYVNANKSATHGSKYTFGSTVIETIYLDSAHTNTDLMFYLPNQAVIFLGDNAGYGRILRNDGGSFSGNIAALNYALESGANVYVPGHGMTGGKEAASEYRDYLSLILEEVKKGYEDDLSDFEIKPLLSPSMDRWKDWSGFEQEFGKHLSQIFLEIEAEDF